MARVVLPVQVELGPDEQEQQADDRQGEIIVFEGVVRAANDQGEVRLASGEAAVAAAGAAPVKRIVVRPRDAVQWALYYPPVLTGGGPGTATTLLSFQIWKESFSMYNFGNGAAIAFITVAVRSSRA